MRRLFIEAYLGICLIMVGGIFSLILLAVVPSFSDYSRLEFKQESAFEYEVVKARLQNLTVDEWPAALAEYSSYFELSASVIEQDQVPKEGASFTLFEGIEGVFFETEDEDFYSFFPSSVEGLSIRFEEGESEWVDPSALLEPLLYLIVGPVVVVLLVMFFGIAYLLYRLSKPLQQLEVALAEFSVSQDTQLPASAVKALPNISHAFNNMASDIQRLLTEQQIMIAAIPHELRTPVARIRFALDLLVNKVEQQNVKGDLTRLTQYVNQLEEITEAVLTFNRIERRQVTPVPVGMSQLINEVCSYQEKRDLIDFKSECDSDHVLADEALLRLALTNLINNACHYTTNRVVIEARNSDDRIVLRIANPGDHLSEIDAEQLFTPFYRADESRSRHSGGLGIGLTLVKKIIESMGGRVSASLLMPDIFEIHIELAVSKDDAL